MFALSWALAAMGGAHPASPALVTPTFVAQHSGIMYYRSVVNVSIVST
jgi:hypothetical protein